ncbi:hypothetical protein DL96DRAFT_504785 [Flagelloscypha sp. PMI_526]|nr:hypothetical protein DL96DRAFT_504785 [Flagelloscypha sp. PMI_526]
MPRPEAELPSELLALIFGHNAWKIILDHGYMHIPYLSVMGVSRAWRQACLGAPHLWTSIQLRLCHQEGCPVFKRSKELFDRVIEYTGNHPLDLEIGPEDLYDWPAWFLRGPRHQDEWALRRLLFVSERWRSVHIHPSILSLVNMDTGHLPILETVSFFDTTGAPNTRDPLYSEWFQEAPELRTVYFSHRDVSLYKFPWTQLSTLSLSQSTPSDLVEISQLCSNLENLSLSRYWDDDQFVADLPVAISFLRLRNFAFDAVHVASPGANTLQFITETMLRMRCPILDRFRLEIMSFPQFTVWSYEELSHALAQFSTIQRLELRGIPCNANQMVHLISSLASLRQLYVLDRYPGSTFPDGFSDSFYDPSWDRQHSYVH